MKLLIVTQTMDVNDPYLGFFGRWVEAFAKVFDRIEVICLREGKHSLPANVRVHSLGKEHVVFARSDPRERRGNPASDPHSHVSRRSSQAKGDSHDRAHGVATYVTPRVAYVVRFLRLIWQLRHEHDRVYVHMNQEYLFLGGPFWRLTGKYVTMWRNHYAGSWRTDVAAFFCHKVFCTSKYSYTAKYKKTVFMPVGVSTELFTPLGPETRVPGSVLSFGRISPSKKLEVFIQALGKLHEKGVAFSATICGDTLPEHEEYAAGLRAQAKALGIAEHITWKPGIPYAEAPALYRAHDIFVNQSPSGMFDKTIFEAMACETLALSCNENLRGVIGEALLFREDDTVLLAEKLEQLLALTREERDALAQILRAYAESSHSLRSLAERLREELKVVSSPA